MKTSDRRQLYQLRRNNTILSYTLSLHVQCTQNSTSFTISIFYWNFKLIFHNFVAITLFFLLKFILHKNVHIIQRYLVLFFKLRKKKTVLFFEDIILLVFY